MSIFRRKPVDRVERRRKRLRRWIIRLVGLMVVAVVTWILAPRILPRIALAQIGELTNTDISAELVDLSLKGTVLIKGLAIDPHTKTPYNNTILTAETVRTRFSLWSLLTFRPRLTRIEVDDFILNGVYDVTADRWNVAGFTLNVKPGAGHPRLPKVSLHNGTFRYIKVINAQPKISFEVPIDADFGLRTANSRRYDFEVATAKRPGGEGKSTISGTWEPGQFTMSGSFRSAHVPTFERTYDIESLKAEFKYEPNSDFEVALQITNLFGTRVPDTQDQHFVVPEFIKPSGPISALQSFFGRYRPWGGIDISLNAKGNLKSPADSKFNGAVTCRDAYLWDRDFPYRLDHLTGKVEFTDSSAQLKDLHAKHGDVDLEIHGGTEKLPGGWRYEVVIGSPNMALDSDLYNALNSGQKKFWDVFSPKGRILYETRIAGGPGIEKRTDMRVELHNIEATCAYFPYPLRNITGTLLFDPDKIKFNDLHSAFDNRQVAVSGVIEFPDANGPKYSIFVDVNDIPLDNMLAAALPRQQQGAYKEFSPTGFGSGKVHVFNSSTDPNAFSFVADLAFRNATLQCPQPAMKITDIAGRAVFRPDSIDVKSLNGVHSDGPISITGLIKPGQSFDEHRYNLTIVGRHAELGEQLLTMMPPGFRKVVTDLNATGRVDYEARIDKQKLSGTPDCTVEVTCLGNSIKYTEIPYPLHNIHGRIVIDSDSVKLEDMTAFAGEPNEKAVHESNLQANGDITLANGGFGGAKISVRAHDVVMDKQFSDNVPAGMAPIVQKLSPKGRLDAKFDTVCVWGNEKGGPSFDFEGTLRLKDCQLAVADGVELDGLLDTSGVYTAGVGFTACTAKLDADSLRARDQSLTDLKANISYDPEKAEWSATQLAAAFNGGYISGQGRFRQLKDGALGYTVQIGLEDVDLKRFLAGTRFKDTAGAQQAAGRITGNLSLRSGFTDSNSRLGSFRVTVDDMKLGKLPPLANLLYVLKLTWPQDFVFTKAYLDSYIVDDSLLVKRLDLAGPALAFYGSGLVNLPDKQVDMVLAARGNRLASADPSVLQSFTEQLGQAVVRLEVTGSYYDPKVVAKPLPLIEDSFGMLRRYHLVPLP